MITTHYWIAKHHLQQSGSSLNVGPGPTDAASPGVIAARLTVVRARNAIASITSKRQTQPVARRAGLSVTAAGFDIPINVRIASYFTAVLRAQKLLNKRR